MLKDPKSARRVAVIALLLFVVMPMIAVVCSYQISCRDDHAQADKASNEHQVACQLIFVPAVAETDSAKETDAANNKQYGDDLPRIFVFVPHLIIRAISDPLVIITAVLAVFTYGLWSATLTLARDAKDAAARQASEVQESLLIARDNAEAAKKSANAADRTAEIMVATAQAELRPYLTVTVSGAVYQERAKNVRFAVRPRLFNSGRTPAHRLKYWARAAILPFPLPDTFDFPRPENVNESAHVIGPWQGIDLDAVVDNFVPDDEVTDIKLGNNRRVYIWGVVDYHDGFHWQTTNFCHSVFWWGTPDGERVSGTYSFKHNEAT